MATKLLHPPTSWVHRSGPRTVSFGLLVLLAAGSTACGEDAGGGTEPDLPGAISLSTVTSGFMKDDSYELLVNGESRGTIGANDQMTLSQLDPATYQLALGDVADNCTLEGTSSTSVAVGSDETVTASLTVTCAAPAPAQYTLRANRDRPNLDDGTMEVCNFGLCGSDDEWDIYVQFNSQSDPQSVIRQNQGIGVEIAHVVGVPLADLTENDFLQANFTTELEDRAFSAGSSILIRTNHGNVFALGNPDEDTLLLTLTFDAVLISQAPAQ